MNTELFHDVQNQKQSTALHKAAGKGHYEKCKSLMKHFSCLDQKDENSRTPLHHASAAGHQKIVNLLISHGAYPNIQDNHGMTPLHLASNDDIAAILVEAGSLMDIRDNEGKTILHTAVENGDVYLVTFLIEAGCEVSPKDRKGVIPLHLAAQKSSEEYIHILTLLLAHDADPSVKNDIGETPLMIAVSDEAIMILKESQECLSDKSERK